MGLDRNQIIGIVVLFGLFMLWTRLNAPTEDELEQRRVQDSIAQSEQLVETADLDNPAGTVKEQAAVEPTEVDSTVVSQELSSRFGVYAPAATGEETFHTLENSLVKITLSSLGGRIIDVHLKDFEQILLNDEKEEYKVPLHMMDDEKSIFEYLVPVPNASNGLVKTSALYFKGTTQGNTVSFTARGTDGSQFVQTYTLPPDTYAIDYDLDVSGAGTQGIVLNWVTYLGKIEKNSGYEKYYTSVYYKEVEDDVDYCSCRKSDVDDLSDTQLKWVSHSNQFFNASLVADNKFGGGQLETEMLEDEDENLKILRSLIDIPLDGRSSEQVTMSMYVGPNEFERLRTFDVSLEDIIPFGSSIFGTINRWIIRPLFNFLLGFIGCGTLKGVT